MTDYKISIVVPVYNVERYLEKCLDTLVNQTFDGYEVIVVNDGSTDGSLAILNKCVDGHKGLVRVFTTENKGVSHARNYGVAKARGEYVLFVDSDDFIEYDMCKLLYRKAVEDDADIVVCDRYDFYEYEETKNIRRIKSNGFYVPFARKINLKTMKYELTRISPFPWDKLFKRELVLRFPFLEGSRFEDLAVMYQIMLTANTISYIPNYLYNYRRTAKGGFLNSLSEETKDILKACRNIIKDFKQYGWYDDYLEEIEYICARHLLMRYGPLVDGEHKGMMGLKREIINETQDFLDGNFDGWRENRYLKYSLSEGMKAGFEHYKKRNAMLRRIVFYEYMPSKCLALINKTRAFKQKITKSFREFKKSKQKFQFLKKRLIFLRVFNQPPAARFTKYYEKLPINDTLVLYESKHGEDIAGNIFRMIVSMGDEAYAGFNIRLALKEGYRERYEELLDAYDIDYLEVVTINTKEYFKCLASAGYLVTDTSFPTYFIKRPGQTYLNTWHGTPIKGMGRVVPGREYALGNIQRNFLMADYLLYQNEFSRDIFLRDYMIDRIYGGRTMVSGYPRNSAFFNEGRRITIRSELDADNCTIIAYMPTWRGLLTKKETDRQVYILLSYLRKIDQSLDNDQVFYVKLHPYVKKRIKYDDFFHIKPFPKEYETYDFLNATDMLVTDYSSIMFDYAASGRDIVLFVYDKEEYISERGMYLDIDKLEFTQAQTVAGLVKAMKNPAPYDRFKEAYCPYDGRDVAGDVVRELFLNRREVDKAVRHNKLNIHRIADNGKKRVLVFLGGLGYGDKTMQLVKYLNKLDTDEYDYYLCANQASVRSATDMISKIKTDIYYFPITFGVNVARKDKVSFIMYFKFGMEGLGIYDKITNMAKRECKKYFMDLRFDYVVNYNAKDKMLHLVCQEMEGTKMLSLLHYDKEIANRKYDKPYMYLLKHMGKYDKVYVSEDVLPLAGKAKAPMDRVVTVGRRDMFVDEMIGCDGKTS